MEKGICWNSDGKALTVEVVLLRSHLPAAHTAEVCRAIVLGLFATSVALLKLRAILLGVPEFVAIGAFLREKRRAHNSSARLAAGANVVAGILGLTFAGILAHLAERLPFAVSVSVSVSVRRHNCVDVVGCW